MNWIIPYCRIGFKGKEIGLPKWFVTSFEPYLKVEKGYEDMRKQRISSLLKYKEGNLEWYKAVTSCVYEEIRRLKAPVIADLYIKTVDKFENSKWPTEYANERDISVYFCFNNIRFFFFLKEKIPPISDNLVDAMARNPIGIYGCHDVEDLVKYGFVRNVKSAEILVSILFQEHMFGLLCEWIKCKWVNPRKYVKQLSQLIAFPLLGDTSNVFRIRRQLLDAVKGVNRIVYGDLVNIFDAEIRRINLERFDEYKRDRDNLPKNFVAYAFADGTKMRPVKTLFSWKLK